jgi:hypothetical protein
VHEINIPTLDPTRFESILTQPQADSFASTLRSAASDLEGRTFWHLNSTASNGALPRCCSQCGASYAEVA